MKILRLAFIFVIPVIIFLLGDCKKDFTSGKLTFSTDTLTFDTVFTSLGSTTQKFKVYNNDNKPVKISDIRLQHLEGNQFRINVDALGGDSAKNVEIPAKDSIYVFVEVTVNPNSSATPFVIMDDVQFIANGNMQTVHLQAFGQNAHFHYGEEITSDVTWANDLPHVILSKGGVPGVLVDCGATLTINPGCKVFFSGNSALFVQGSLVAKATSWTDSIIFRGVRLEQFYQDKPGQWFGIVFLRDSAGSCVSHGDFSYCVVDESTYGIYAGAGLSTNISTYLSTAARPQVNMSNCIVKNTQNNAVYGFNAEIHAENSLFYAAGDNMLKFGLGGLYTFNYCTMYNTGSQFVDHQKESLLLSNFAIVNNQPYEVDLTTSFTNCVLYGNLDNEISFNNYDDTVKTFFHNVFSYSLLKSKTDTVQLFASSNDNNKFNQDPQFFMYRGRNFTPLFDTTGGTRTFSPCVDYCPYVSTNPNIDLYGGSRPITHTLNQNKYDIGAVEAP